jgi:hypothetical protein
VKVALRLSPGPLIRARPGILQRPASIRSPPKTTSTSGRVQAPAGLKLLFGVTVPLARRVIAFTSDELNRNHRRAVPTTATAPCRSRTTPPFALAHAVQLPL